MSTKKQAVKAPKTKASDMFFLAAVAFVLLLIEPMFNTFFNVSGFNKTIISRSAYTVIWVFCSKLLMNSAKKECGFEIFKKEKPLSPVGWVVLSVATAAIVGYFVWNKLSVFEIIFKNIAVIKVVMAYISMIIVNIAKALVITIFIAFIQKGLSISCKKAKWVPLGGIILGLIWCGMFLLASVGTVFQWTNLIYQLAYGLSLGILFVLADNKARYAFPFIAVSTFLIFLF